MGGIPAEVCGCHKPIMVAGPPAVLTDVKRSHPAAILTVSGCATPTARRVARCTARRSAKSVRLRGSYSAEPLAPDARQYGTAHLTGTCGASLSNGTPRVLSTAAAPTTRRRPARVRRVGYCIAPGRPRRQISIRQDGIAHDVRRIRHCLRGNSSGVRIDASVRATPLRRARNRCPASHRRHGESHC